MIFYILYRIGHFLALQVPLKLSYNAAVLFADIDFYCNPKERRSLIENFKIIFNKTEETKELRAMARNVFRNFAKYLVDFFRFSVIDSDYIRKFVKMEGLENIEEALKRGKGVIILSAHMGNWELGGYALGKIGYNISAVVLTHKNEKINEFFINQRKMGNFKSIEIGASLRSCYSVLKNNELLALLGDRNFSSNGLAMDFFGKKVLMPRGPAALSARTGAAAICGYMIRQPDDTFSICFEKPIYPPDNTDEEICMEEVMKQYVVSLERAVLQNPEQWYMFKEFWVREKKYGKDMCSDTVV